MESMEYVKIVGIVMGSFAILTGLSKGFKAIAAATKNTKDDAVASWLGKAVGFIGKIIDAATANERKK